MLLRGDPRRGHGQRRLWALARALVARSASPGDLNQALMELGATVCTPLTPDCEICPVARLCAARAAGVQERVPPSRWQRTPVTIRSAVGLVARRGCLLMRRREGTGLMDGLWEFPPLQGDGGPLRLRSRGRIGSVRHAITYRRLHLDVHRADLLAEPRGPGFRWIRPRDLRTLPVSSLAAKVLRCAGSRV
jgi:A/G-specific adenine glycosylase